MYILQHNPIAWLREMKIYFKFESYRTVNIGILISIVVKKLSSTVIDVLLLHSRMEVTKVPIKLHTNYS